MLLVSSEACSMLLQGCQGQEPVLGCWMSWWILVEFRKCLIPLIAHSHFPHLQLPLGKNSFSEPSRAHCHLILDLLLCQRCCPDNFSSLKVPQARLLLEYLGVVFFSFSFSLGLSTSSADGISIMFFCKVHMAYKREYLFNCKTWPPVQILMSAGSIRLHTSPLK